MVRDPKPIEIDFSDTVGIVKGIPGAEEDISLENYDVTIDYDNLFIERVEFEKKDDKLIVTPVVYGDWCECFVPDTLTFRVRMIPNNGDVHAEPYEVPIKIGVLHQTVWIGRCLWALIVMGVLLVLFFYLRALLRKRRFKKNATIIPVYYNRYKEEVDDGSGQRLRKSGFKAWFARWFLPGIEKRALFFESPAVGMLKFRASETGEVVEVPKEAIDFVTLEVDGYDPASDNAPSRPIRLGINGRIYVNKADGSRDGYLYYTPGNERDGTGFRLFLSVLMIADIVAVMALTTLIVLGVI